MAISFEKFVTVCRRETFSAAHRLHNPRWSDARNSEVFGLCNSPNYHGHNYVLIVQLTGAVNPDLGYVYDLKKLSLLVQKEVISRYDHCNLNLDVEDFKDRPPTTENIAISIYDRLRIHIEKEHKLGIILHETEKNYVQYSPE